MRTIRYKLDSESLAYVAIKRDLSMKLRALGVFMALAALTASIAFVKGWADQLIYAGLSWQNQVYLSQIDTYANSVAQMQKELADLHSRDQQLYRSLLNIQSLDAGVWEAGYGGGQTYTRIEPIQLRYLAEKVHTLCYQANLQRLAYEEIRSEAERMHRRTRSFPVVVPAKGVYVSGFGHRCTSHYGAHLHTGVDLAARHGAPVYAAGAGVVQVVGWPESGYGLQVQIDHQNGYVTRYAHLSAALVRLGQQVEPGEQIAKIGSTGFSTGPHLHYEVIHQGHALNPLPFMMLQACQYR